MKKKKHKRFVPNYHGVVAEAIDLWLIYVAYTNIGLAIFNLIPIPPLDGSRLVFTVLPNKVYTKTMKAGTTFAYKDAHDRICSRGYLFV